MGRIGDELGTNKMKDTRDSDIRDIILDWADQFENDHYSFNLYGSKFSLTLPRETVEAVLDISITLVDRIVAAKGELHKSDYQEFEKRVIGCTVEDKAKEETEEGKEKEEEEMVSASSSDSSSDSSSNSQNSFSNSSLNSSLNRSDSSSVSSSNVIGGDWFFSLILEAVFDKRLFGRYEDIEQMIADLMPQKKNTATYMFLIKPELHKLIYAAIRHVDDVEENYNSLVYTFFLGVLAKCWGERNV